MNYYESEYYSIYTKNQEMQRKYRVSFLKEPNRVNTNYRDWREYFSDIEMNNLRFMVMSVELIKAKGKINEQEINYLRNMYTVNCSERFINHYMQLLYSIMHDNNDELEWALNIRYGSYSMNKEMVVKLFEFAALDGKITSKEFLFVKNVAERIGIKRSDFMEITIKYNIDKENEDHTFRFNQSYGGSLTASFLAQTPGQYHIQQFYKNWQDLCFDLQEQENDKRNLSFLVLASVVITADGPINQAELNFMKKLYSQNCGSARCAMIYILKLRDILKEAHVNWQKYADNLYNIFFEEDKYKSVYSWEKSNKVEIVETLFKLAEVDSKINQSELKILWEIAQNLEVTYAFQKIASKFDITNEDNNSINTTTNTLLGKAYRTIQVSEKATDEMVKKTYRRMAQQYHPDRCTDFSQKTYYEIKMREINEAYKIIMESRKIHNVN